VAFMIEFINRYDVPARSPPWPLGGLHASVFHLFLTFSCTCALELLVIYAVVALGTARRIK
jgi:hypothetical protein